jgi:DNA-binding XRE family transcriptional regulator
MSGFLDLFTSFFISQSCQNRNTFNTKINQNRKEAEMLSEHSPNRLSLLRRQRGLSQKQLAALVGQARTIISAYERGHVVPNLAVAGMFQLFFGVNIAEIFPQLFIDLRKELETNRQRLCAHLERTAQRI